MHAPDTYGYDTVTEVGKQTEASIQKGLLHYHGGFRISPLHVQSSRPEEMLEAAVNFGADVGLIKKLRALAAAERISLDPTKVNSTVSLYGLDAEEKRHVAEILSRYEENWTKSVDTYGRAMRPNKPVVEEIRQLLSA